MNKRIFFVLLIISALSISLAACAPAPTPEVVEKVVEKEVIVTVIVEGAPKEIIITATPEPTVEPRPVKKVASNVQLPLNIYREGTEIKGFEYEVYTEALNRAGYDVEVVDVAFAGIFAGLQAEKWDMACSGIYITKAREDEMDFTEPFRDDFDVVIGKADGDVNSLEDLKGKVAGTETGTSEAAYLASLMAEYGPFETQLYEDKETSYLDLESGRIVALTDSMEAFVIRKAEYPNIKVIAGNPDKFMEGCALRTGDPLKAEIDKAIESMKADGTIQEMYERNFGVPVEEGSATDTIFTEEYVPLK